MVALGVGNTTPGTRGIVKLDLKFVGQSEYDILPGSHQSAPGRKKGPKLIRRDHDHSFIDQCEAINKDTFRISFLVVENLQHDMIIGGAVTTMLKADILNSQKIMKIGNLRVPFIDDKQVFLKEKTFITGREKRRSH